MVDLRSVNRRECPADACRKGFFGTEEEASPLCEGASHLHRKLQ